MSVKVFLWQRISNTFSSSPVATSYQCAESCLLPSHTNYYILQPCQGRSPCTYLYLLCVRLCYCFEFGTYIFSMSQWWYWLLSSVHSLHKLYTFYYIIFYDHMIHKHTHMTQVFEWTWVNVCMFFTLISCMNYYVPVFINIWFSILRLKSCHSHII